MSVIFRIKKYEKAEEQRMRTTTQQAPKLLREYPMYFTLGSAEELDGEVQLVRPSWECGW